MNNEELRSLLKKQVEKFEGERVTVDAGCAFCDVVEERCYECLFPYHSKVLPFERCIRGAVLDGETDNECLGGQEEYPPARAKLWADWYRAWLDSPTLTPPPLEWKEEG